MSIFRTHAGRLRFLTALNVLVAAALFASAADAQRQPEPSPRPRWKASWIAHPTAPLREPAVFHFQKTIRLNAAPARFLVHVSADTRFILYVNGSRIGEGPARADLSHWRYETFDLAPALKPGENVIAAIVWQYGVHTPLAQFSDRAAFLMEGDTEAETSVTTDDTWLVELETGHSFVSRVVNGYWAGLYAAGPGERIDAATYNWDWKQKAQPAPSRWVHAASAMRESIYPSAAVASSRAYGFESIWALVPDPLPPMEYSPVAAGRVVRTDLAAASSFPNAPVVIPASRHVKILLDRQTMVNGYPELTVSGGEGSRVTVRYTEALFDSTQLRRNRNQVGDLQVLSPLQEEFLPDGQQRSFMPLTWRTWRYLELEITTAQMPLRLGGMRVYFTAYPFVERARFESDDPELAGIWEFCWRGARLGARETYMDTPFWEQLQYIGDTRIQALISYTVAGDDRLAQQALRAFDDSRRSDGLTQSRYPSHMPQYIPPFSMLFVNMLHDYWMYRPDSAFVKEILPGTRATLQWFLRRQRADGFLEKLPYWQAVDSPNQVKSEWPPLDAEGRSSIQTLLFVGALRDAAEIEAAIGDETLAMSYRRQAQLAADAVYHSCWNSTLGLIADTPEQRSYSQHANLYAILFDVIPQSEQTDVMRKILAADVPTYRTETRPELAHVSYMFTFYLARAIQHAGFGDDYLQVIKPWREMLHKGLTTAPEYPDPNRSDTHAWSAHPVYDLLTIVAGITPAAPGFARIRIAPNLRALAEVSAAMPHPAGMIEARYKRKGDALEASITLPKGLEGVLVWNGHEYPLRAGNQTIVASGK
jgi:alpha-L-rhamnosidase